MPGFIRHNCKIDEGIHLRNFSSDNIVQNNAVRNTGNRRDTFDGSRFSGSHADSWVDVKGNGWTIEGNVGRNSTQGGFQTHEVVDGWGTDNVFMGNSAEVNGPGYGFNFTPTRNNRVTCDNRVAGAATGFSNVPCG